MELHVSMRRRIDLLFEKGVGDSSRKELFEHLETCEACAAHYDRHLKLESALCVSRGSRAEESSAPTRGDEVFSVFAVERVRSAVLDGAVKPAGEPLTARYRCTAVAFGAVALVALVTLVLFFPRQPTSDKSPLPAGAELAPVYIASRGAEQDEQAGIGIRVFRVVDSGERVLEKGGLGLGDTITFTYTRVEKGAGYLALFGVQPSGEIRWYYPDYDEDRSVRIEGDKVDEPLRDGIRLGVNHEPGPLRIVSVFSSRPIDKPVIESAVAGLFDTALEFGELKPLSLEFQDMKTLEYSILVEIAGSDEGR